MHESAAKTRTSETAPWATQHLPPSTSLLSLSLGQRLLPTAVIIALLWGAVWWALT